MNRKPFVIVSHLRQDARMRSVLILLWLCLSSPAFALPVSMLQDLTTGPPSLEDADPRDLVVMGSHVYFAATEPQSGRELWKSDGTPAGTTLVRDIVPGNESSAPSYLTVVGSTLFFVATTPAFGGELWKTDGTTEGTVLVADLEPGIPGSDPYRLKAVGDALYLIATTSDEGYEMRTSDGATIRALSATPGPASTAIDQFLAAGTQVYFSAGGALYATGPSASSVVVGATGQVAYLTAFGDKLLFSADFGGDRELWESSGGGAPSPVADLNPTGSSDPFFASVVDGVAYFPATGPSGRQLWRYDGISPPAAVTDLPPSGVVLQGVAGVSGRLYFIGSDVGPYKLMTSPGSPAAPGQTVLSEDLGATNLRLGAIGDRAFCAGNTGSGYDLWGSDGTPGASGTVAFDVLPDNGNAFFLGVFAGRLYIYDGASGNLFSTDGSVVEPPSLIGRSNGTSPAELPGGTVLVASGGSTANRQLYSAGASPALVKAIGARANSTDPLSFGTVGATTYLTSGTLRQLLSMQGGVVTPLVLVGASGETITTGPAVYGGKVYVGGYDDVRTGTYVLDPALGPPASFIAGVDFGNGPEKHSFFDGRVYVADGARLVDISGTTVTEHALPASYPERLTLAGGQLYFILDGEGAADLWQVTPGGAMAQAATGPISYLASAGATLYFASQSTQLFAATNGEPPALIKDFGLDGCTISDLAGSGARVFFSANCPATGAEPWTSDGTATGTVALGDLWPGANGSYQNPVGTLGDFFFFAAHTPTTGTELWRTNGTPEGTVLVKDIATGQADANPERGAVAQGGLLWFAAGDLAHGIELWRTDGTESGTSMVFDVEPGMRSSAPKLLTVGGGGVLFSALTMGNGLEAYLVGPFADLGLTVSASTGSPVAGVPFTITATIDNAGPAEATTTTLDFVVPTGLVVTAVSGATCDALPATAVTLRCTADAPGEVVFTASAMSAGALQSSFALTPALDDFTTDDLTATVDVTALPAPVVDLVVSAMVTPTTVELGQRATLTATLSNAGPNAASNVVLTATMDAAVNVSSASVMGVASAACTVAGAVVTCNIGALGNAASVTASLVIEPLAAGTVTATLNAQATEADAVASNNQVSVTLSTQEATPDAPAANKSGCACGHAGPADAVPMALAALLLLLRATRRSRRDLASATR